MTKIIKSYTKWTIYAYWTIGIYKPYYMYDWTLWTGLNFLPLCGKIKLF